MADQTIEIKLILRDEMSKALAPIEAQLKRIGETRVDKFHGAMDRLAPAVRVVHRELSTLSRITLGGLVGGGVIAGLATLTKSLQDMAAQNIQLRYTAQSLGVSTKFIEDYKSALVGLGESPQTAASAITGALKTLDEFMVKGSKSSLGSFLKESIGGDAIAGQLRQIIAKQGEQAGLEFLVNVAKRITDRKGRAEFLRQVQLPYSALGVDKMLSQLPERIELSTEQVDAMAIANMQLERHSENIKQILAGAMLPAITAITKSLSDYLQTQAGQKFSKQLGEIAGDISKAISTWITEGGLKSALDTLVAAFGVADTVIKAIGLSWPQAIGVLVGIKFAAWLGEVATGLKGIMPYAALLALLIAAQKIARGFDPKSSGNLPRDLLADILRGSGVDLPPEAGGTGGGYEGGKGESPAARGEEFWQYLQRKMMEMIQPQKQSSLGKPETEQEQRAAAATDAAERKSLNDKLEDLAIGTAQLADYIGQTAIGGPDGTPGESGLGAGLAGNRGGGSMRERAAAALADVNRSLAEQAAGRDPRRMQRALERVAPGSNEEWMLRTERALKSLDPSMAGIAPSQFQGGMLPGPGELKSTERNIENQRREYESDPYYDKPGWLEQRRDLKYNQGVFGSGLSTPPGMPINFRGGATSISGGSGSVNVGGDSIINALARGDGSGGMNGSASIDIDVGGLGQPERDPSSLFKPQPIDGAVQMQPTTQPQHNPLSLQ